MVDNSTNQSTVVDVVCEEKDLGIWCTSDLKPSLHCQRTAAKAAWLDQENLLLYFTRHV